jgi:hypothetical protein
VHPDEREVEIRNAAHGDELAEVLVAVAPLVHHDQERGLLETTRLDRVRVGEDERLGPRGAPFGADED